MDALRAMGRADGAIGRRKAPIGRLVEAIGRADGAIGEEARGEETPTPTARNLIKSYCAKSHPLHGSPKSITTAPSSKRACNKELALLVEVAAVSPLPTRSRSSWGPRLKEHPIQHR